MSNNSNNIMPKKKRFGFIRFIIKFILLSSLSIIIIVGLIIGSIYGYYSYKASKLKKINDEILMNNVVVDKNTKIELKDLPKEEWVKDYDNDGLTNEEEDKLGISCYSMDSDMDGINDFDEVKKYNTNPAKYSTSGDEISDMIKIYKKLDVNKVYSKGDLKSKQEISASDRIKLYPKDMCSEVEYTFESYSGTAFDGLIELLPPFTVANFEGDIKVDLKDYDMSKAKISVYYFDINTSKVKKLKKVKLADSIMSFSAINGCPTVIVDESLIDSLMFNSSGEFLSETFSNAKKDYYLIAFPFMYFFDDMKVYIVELDDVAVLKGMQTNEKLKNKLQSILPDWTIEHFYASMFLEKVVLNVYNKFSKMLEDNAFEGKYLNLIFWMKKIHCSETDMIADAKTIVLGQKEKKDDKFADKNKKPENSIKELSKEEKEKLKVQEYYNSDSGFKPKINGFNFSNLCTTQGKDGVCAGFAYMTMQIFNGYGVSRKEKDLDGYSDILGYDLTDKSFDTIFDKKPYFYKIKDSNLQTYADDISGNNYKYLNGKEMVQPEGNLALALGYHWANNNRNIGLTVVSERIGGYDNDFTVIQQINENLKKGKIVFVGLSGGIGGHAINAYKLEQDEKDTNTFKLYLYDSNCPGNTVLAALPYDSSKCYRKEIEVAMIIKRSVAKVLKADYSLGEKEVFNFSYAIGSNYSWNNRKDKKKELKNGDVIFFIADEAGNMSCIKGNKYTPLEKIDMEITPDSIGGYDEAAIKVTAFYKDGSIKDVTNKGNCRITVPFGNILDGRITSEKRFKCHGNKLLKSDGVDVPVKATFDGKEITKIIHVKSAGEAILGQ